MPPGKILDWFGPAERSLPWRANDISPWQILVSEVMLAQTPVARVITVWTEWIERWPTPSALAAAPTSDVLRAWGKLGYPRRALRLVECARRLAQDFDDTVPADVDTLLSLPGIGDYTARAVACFAFGMPVPVVDTNVRRVIARAVHGRAIAGNPSSRRDLADADAVAPRDPDGSYSPQAPRFSAAVMELGALVCTARNPKCEECPLIATCSWYAADRPPHDGPPPRRQSYAGTDRQVRGMLLDVLRDTTSAVPRARLDAVWPDPVQRDRALDSLVADGLVTQSATGQFQLPD